MALIIESLPLNSTFQENIESKKAKIKMMIEERMEKIHEFTVSSEMTRVSIEADSVHVQFIH